MNEVLTPYPTDRLHKPASPTARFFFRGRSERMNSGGQSWTPIPWGVAFPRRITLVSVDHAGNGPKRENSPLLPAQPVSEAGDLACLSA